MISIFGSMSYGLFLNRYSDVDIGVNLRIVDQPKSKKRENDDDDDDEKGDRRKKKKEQTAREKEIEFLNLLTAKIRIKIKKEEEAKRQRKRQSPAKKELNKYQKEHRKLMNLRRKMYGEEDGPRWDRDVKVKEQVFAAAVPIVKLHVFPLKLPVDLSVHRGSNVVSKVMMVMVKYDDRVRPLLCAIKYWARCRSINNAFKSFLCPFGWILFAVKFLQHGLDRPILPMIKLEVDSGSVLMNKSNLKEPNG